MSKMDWLRFWGVGLLWSTSFLWIKIAVTEITPFILVGFRTLFGAVGLLVIILLNKKNYHWHDFSDWVGIFVVIGLLNIAIPFLLISWSEQFIPSGVASILNTTVPLFTAFLALSLLREDKITLIGIIGLIIGFAGVVILFIPELIKGARQDMIALGAMLLAAILYAFSGILIKIKVHGLQSEIQAFLQLALGSIIVWSFTLISGQPIILPQRSITWVALLWLGFLGSSLAYFFYFGLLHSAGPTRTAMVTYVPPLIGLLLGAIVLGESLGWYSLLGGIMIILGIIMVNMKQKLPLEVAAEDH
jgi:drug/metabolite transporter (DMT)-like permease